MTPELPTLSAAELPHYLLERGLLDREGLVDGDLQIAEATRRNRNFKVLRREAPSYFVKQARTASVDATASLRREAVCYELAAKVPGYESLREFLPDYHGYDPQRHLLVLGLLPRGKSAAERIGWWQPDPRVAARVGRALGRFHRISAGLAEAAPEQAFPQNLPWVLWVYRMPEGFMPVTSAGQHQLLGQVRSDPRAHRALQTAASSWRVEGLIHGDLKWDNLILLEDGEIPDVRIIDWELADLGDPAWDLGALLQAFVSQYAAATPAEGQNPQLWAGLKGAAQALAGAYAEARQLDARAASDFFLRAIRLGGGRMVQTAFEHLFQSPQPTPQSQGLLETAYDMTERPAEWTRQLLY